MVSWVWRREGRCRGLIKLVAEFAFYVNKNGWRAKSNWIIQWEGFPTSFGELSFRLVPGSPPLTLFPFAALHYPYVLAFEPTFIEVRHVESGALMQIIPGNNIKCLFADTPPSASSSSANSYFPSPNAPYGYRGPPVSSGRSESESLPSDELEKES